MGCLWQTPVLKVAARNSKAVQEVHNRGRKRKVFMEKQEAENVEAHQKGKYENMTKCSPIRENSYMQTSSFKLRDGKQGTSHI